MPYGYYNYGQQTPYYAPPMPDQLAQLRNNQYQQAMNQQPIMQNQPAMQANPQPVPNQNNNMIWVQGEAGAKSFLIGNGNTVPLWDSENQTIYLKSVDNSGIPSMRILDYTERNTATKTPFNGVQNSGVEYVTRDEFNALAAEIEALRAKKCNCRTKATDKNTSSDDEKE